MRAWTTAIAGVWLVVLAATAACRGEHGPPRQPAQAAHPGAPARPAATSPARAAAPDLAELRRLLAPHADRRFDPGAIERGCPADQTLGQYLAMLERNVTEEPTAPGQTQRFTGQCGEFPADVAPVDPPADPAHWYCRIDAYSSAEPWHYELRLRVRRADRVPDVDHLGCPGTP